MKVKKTRPGVYRVETELALYSVERGQKPAGGWNVWSAAAGKTIYWSLPTKRRALEVIEYVC